MARACRNPAPASMLGTGSVMRTPDIVGVMVSIEDAARMATELPAVTEGTRFGNRTWFVRDKGFLWERPFSKADLKRFGTDTPPDGPIMAAIVEDLGEKEAVLASGVPGLFTISHFDNYPAVLIHMRTVTKRAMREVVVDAWLACAPAALAAEFVASSRRRR